MKLRISLALLVALLLATVAAGAAPPDPPHPGPAMFEDTEWCEIFDVNWKWYYLEKCLPQVALITNSRTGLIIFSAKAELPEGAALPERGAYVVTYENSDFCCWWDDDTVTTNYSIVITPDGLFNIECIFRPDKWQPD
jgi:hypothetical protein